MAGNANWIIGTEDGSDKNNVKVVLKKVDPPAYSKDTVWYFGGTTNRLGMFASDDMCVDLKDGGF